MGRANTSATNSQQAWAEWHRLLKRSSGTADLAPVTARLHRLSFLAQLHKTADIQAVCTAFAKGHALLLAACRWKNGSIGTTPHRPNPTDRARALQWRLVMAYGGFETFTAPLLAGIPSADKVDQLKTLCDDLPLAACPPIAAPLKQSATLKSFLTESGLATGGRLTAFLGLRAGDRAGFERWLGTPGRLDTWPDALRLAKALRNATAHGSLSATKARTLGFLPAFEALPDHLSTVVEAALLKLTDSNSPQPKL